MISVKHVSSVLALLAVAGLVQVVPAEAQEISSDRFRLSPVQIQYAVGSLRLDGMGGFRVAVADENNEVNLIDFAENPAGFGDDKRSWVMETRYTHREYVLSPWQDETNTDPIPRGTEDLKAREALIRFSKYVPGKYGAGVQVNTSSAKAFSRGELSLNARDYDFPVFEEFDVVRFNAIVNRYLGSKVSVGASLDLNAESSVSNTENYYDIDHDAAGVRGGLGLAYNVVRGVTLGARGELVSNQIDGVSEDGIHLDEFTWERPVSLLSGHIFVNRGRLNMGFDYTEKDAEGFEDVVTSWSSRYRDNPGDEEISQELDVFSEDRFAVQRRARVDVSVTDEIQVSGMIQSQDVDFDVVSVPNVRGSLEGQTVDHQSETTILGGSWELMNKRLLLAGEYESSTSDLRVVFPDTRLDNEFSTLENTALRVGGEYFLNKSLLLRGGIVQETLTLEIKDYHPGDPDIDADNPPVVENGSGEYSTTRVAAGVGLLPNGGILQIDIGLDAVLTSDLETRHTNVGAYVKYLF